jgi:5-methylcytosine-specific restriction protein B
MTNNNGSDQFEQYHNEGRLQFITFHPSYSYEEFVEGLTAYTEKENKPTEKIQYILKAGIFKEMCKRALLAAIGENDWQQNITWAETFEKYKEKGDINWENSPKFVLIIDEINRGDMSKIMGELITLLEPDKRLGADNEIIATLPASGDQFSVPQNVYIIATMNTADRSIALLDVALRRRFGFLEMKPDLSLVLNKDVNTFLSSMEEGDKTLLEKSVQAVKVINTDISADESLGKDKQIGHSFLLTAKNSADIEVVWGYDILPLLEEYTYGRTKKLKNLLFRNEAQDISLENINTFLGLIIDARK